MPGTPAVAGSTSNTTSQQVFAVNDITFHKQHGTFCTSGGDGGFTFWDGVQKTKIKRESWSRRQDLGCHFFGPSWQRRRAGCSQRSLLTTRVQPERPQQWRHGCQTTKIRNFDRLGLVQPQPRDSRIVSLKSSLEMSSDASAISYDWSKGHTGVPPSGQNVTKVMLHPVKSDEVTKKKVGR